MFNKEAIKFTRNIGLAAWMKVFAYGILLAGVYFSTFSWLIIHDWSREDYNYAYLIPLIVLYLLWEKRKALAEIPSLKSWNGLIFFIIGIALFWLGELAGEFFSLYLSFWIILISLCWLHLGWKKIKTISFPLIFILAMFPLPNFIYTKVTFDLKLISSKLGVKLLQLYGMSAYREGNIIDLGFTQLQVIDACSGLRYLFSLIVLSILIAYFFKGGLWKKAIIVISSIPISIVTNSFRIALTGILYEVWGPKVAEGFFHGFSGWLIFIIALGILLIEMWFLKKIFPEKIKKDIISPEPQPKPQPEPQPEPHSQSQSKASDNRLQVKGVSTFFRPPQFIVAIILLGATLAFSQGIEFREKIPIKKSFDLFPLQINEWSGTRETMEQIFLNELDLSDYVIVNYKDKSGKDVNFYVAYYQSQRKGESIHSPETCLPGSGWEFREAGTVNIPLIKGNLSSIKINRAFMVKPGANELVYFWFPQRGRILTSLYQLKIYTFWDALTRQRTDGALVRVITPVYQNEQLQDSEARLRGLQKKSYQYLRSLYLID